MSKATKKNNARAKLFVNAHIVDPSQGLDGPGVVLVKKGKIAEIGSTIDRDKLPKSIKTIDCNGHVLAPGLVDMRVFGGEPGAEHRETIGSLGKAAAAGSHSGRASSSPPHGYPWLILTLST